MAKKKKKSNRNSTKQKIEKQYIVFFDSDIDLSWNVSDVEKFCSLWNEGKSILDISSTFKRIPLEVVLLTIDLAEQEKINRRPNGIYGM